MDEKGARMKKMLLFFAFLCGLHFIMHARFIQVPTKEVLMEKIQKSTHADFLKKEEHVHLLHDLATRELPLWIIIQLYDDVTALYPQGARITETRHREFIILQIIAANCSEEELKTIKHALSVSTIEQ